MMPPTPNPSPEKHQQVSLPVAADEKEVETDQEIEIEKEELSYLRSASSRPITPAKFLENMSRRKEHESRDGDVPVFALGDNSTDDKGADFLALDQEQIYDISTMFELDCDGVEVEDPESGDSAHDKLGGGGSGGSASDLRVVGTKVAISVDEDEEAEDFEDEEPAVGMKQDHVTAEEDDHESVDENEQHQKSLSEYIPQKFKGLDVKRWSEWTESMEFSKQSGLIVVEVYSVVFGPSDAMYPFIEDLVRHRPDRVRFIRLSLHTMSTMEVVHEAIVDHKDYYPSPFPTFVLIKNGKKVGQLTGTKPAELGTLIEKHVAMQQRAATVPVSPVSVKYRSILQRKPRKPTSSSMFQTPRKQVVSVVERGEENIKNLLRSSPTKLVTPPSEHASPTKLWKNDDMLLID